MPELQFFFLFCHILVCLSCLLSLYRRGPAFTEQALWKTGFLFLTLPLFPLISRIPAFPFKWTLLYLPLILAFLLKSLLNHRGEQKLMAQFEFFIRHLIAQIKIGLGFRPAFKSALQFLAPCFQSYFKEILESIVFSKKPSKEKSSPILRHLTEELKRADSSSRALPILENLRHHLHIRSVFRQKAESALLQVRIQSLVLSLLYTGLIIFVLHKYGLKHIKILSGSLLLFITGLLLLLKCGRKIRWTV